LAANFR